jgi:hypothetical protein
MPTTFLATKSANPTQLDDSKAMQILAYVNTTKHKVMHFKDDADLVPRFFADASHMLHKDLKGHEGIIGMLETMGNAPILTKSFKLKLVTQ